MKMGLSLLFFTVLLAVCSFDAFAEIQNVILWLNKTNEDVSTTEATTTAETTMLPVNNPMEYYLLAGCDKQYSDCQRLVYHEIVPSLEFCETEKNECERKVYQITATTTTTLETTTESTTTATTTTTAPLPTTTLDIEADLLLQCSNNYTECLHLIDQALVPSLEFCQNKKKECDQNVRSLNTTTITTLEATPTTQSTIGKLTDTTSTITTTTMPSTIELTTTISAEDYLLSLCKSRFDDCKSLLEYGKVPSLEFCESEKSQCDQKVRQITETTMTATPEDTTTAPISTMTTPQGIITTTTNIETKKQQFACAVELELCRFEKKSDKCDVNYAECNQKVLKTTTIPTTTATTLPPMTIQGCRKIYRDCKRKNIFSIPDLHCRDTLDTCEKAVRNAYQKP